MDNNESLNSENIRKSRKKKKHTIKIIIAMLLIVIAIIVCKKLFIKSNSQRFVELLTKDQYALEVFNGYKNELLKDGEKTAEIIIDPQDELKENPLFSVVANKKIIKINAISQSGNIDSEIVLDDGSTSNNKIEFLKEEGLIALNIPEVYDGYFSISSENLDSLAEKLGYVTNQTLKDEEVKQKSKKIAEKYLKVLIDSLNQYTKTSKVEQMVNGENYKTKEYKISLGTMEFDEIKLALLNKLKSDDETIKFIADTFSKTEYYSKTFNLPAEEFEKELKKDIKNEIEQLNSKDYTNEKILNEIIVMSVYEYDGKAIKTSIKYKDTKKYDTYEIVLNSANSNIVVSLNIEEGNEKLNIDLSVKNNKNASGENVFDLTLTSGGKSYKLANITLGQTKELTKAPRTISSLNALLLNTASEKELKWVKRLLNPNENEEKEPVVTIEKYEEGQFVLKDPENPVKILEEVKERYQKVEPGMTEKEVIAIYGKPGSRAVLTTKDIKLTWYKDAEERIILNSVTLRDGVVFSVSTSAHSSMDDNVQLSKEVGVKVDNLEDVIDQIKVPEISLDSNAKTESMTKDEVIAILGENYIEVHKTSYGNTRLKWYDKNENSVEITFTKDWKTLVKTKVKSDGYGIVD